MFNKTLKKLLEKKNKEIEELKEKIESLKDQINSHVMDNRKIKREQDYTVQSIEDEYKDRIRQVNEDAESLIETKRKETKKELEALYKKEIDDLKKENKEMFERLMESNGKYDGAIGIIKNLENQLTSSKDFSSKLIEKLPSVSANIKSADSSVNILK